MAATTSHLLLQPLEMATILTLAFTSGLSFCLSTWVIPNALLAPPKTMTRQFLATIARGERYLQPSSRILGLCLLSVTYLTAQHPEPAVAGRWRCWAACLAILVPVAPYEIFAIFPVNDQVKEIDAQIGKISEEREQKLRDLLRSWQIRNFGRILPPLLASIVGLWTIISA